MQVLGVDPIREVILPRVVAVTIITGLMDMLALLCAVFGGWLAALQRGRTPTRSWPTLGQRHDTRRRGQRCEDIPVRSDHRGGELL